MTPKLVIALGLCAAITTAGAVVSYRSNNVFVPRAGVGEKVMSGLGDKINDLAEIVVAQGTKKLALVQKDGNWQVKATGYPVSAAKVKKALVGLTDLTKLEAKTANSAKYLLISVDGPGKKDGRGNQITLLDKSGAKAGEIVLGKILANKAGPGRDAQYVRRSAEATSWLVLGSVRTSPSLTSWVEPRFLKLDVDSVVKGTLKHADGETINVQRSGKLASGSSIFELLNVPEGRKARTSTTIKFTATDLVNLDLEDVRRQKSGTKPVVEAQVELDGGLKLDLSLVEEKGKGWVTVKVADAGSKKKLADEITARTKGWEFQISDFKKRQFKRRLENLLEKKK